MSYTDNEIIEKLRQGDQKVLKHLFDVYFRDLLICSLKYVINSDIAEEIVQDVFIQIWKNRKVIQIKKSLSSYLFTSVKNRSLNHIKSKHARMQFVELGSAEIKISAGPADETLISGEMKASIQEAINTLPPKCRIIFNLSRNAEMSTAEIAGELNISVKTVHAQIGIALKKIREHLKDQWDNILS